MTREASTPPQTGRITLRAFGGPPSAGRAQVAVLLLLGCVITACAFGTLYALHTQRTTQIRNIVVQRRTDSDIAAIAKRVFKLERPTTAELNAAVLVALKSCTKDEPCRTAFMDAAPRGKRGATGPTGAAGKRGAAGKAGPTGARGAAGKTGKTGAVGPRGPVGPGGAVGASPSAEDVAASLQSKLCKLLPALRSALC